ncbi:MAG: patatin-like phospholipase family protein [Myxococcota bacterium]
MDYEALVFAGGGCRCFWQAGFYSTAAEATGLRPQAIAAVSAGSAFACGAIGGALEAIVDEFERRTAENPRNIYPRNVMRTGLVFPHEPMYRGTILETMNGEVLRRVHAGPEIRVLLSRPPRRISPLPAVLLGYTAYGVDRLLRKNVHATLAKRLGFRKAVVVAQSCQSPAELADLIMQSSCMPPLTPLFRRDGAPVIDGALLDSAPADLVDEFDRTLVLLSRRYETLPQHPRRDYVQPSQDLSVKMWDYTRPDLVRETFELGLRDGAAFAADPERYLRATA